VRESLSIRKTNSYDVEWEHGKVRQNTSVPLDGMSAMFDSEIHSFEVTYEIRADNLREVTRGSVHVIAADAPASP